MTTKEMKKTNKTVEKIAEEVKETSQEATNTVSGEVSNSNNELDALKKQVELLQAMLLNNVGNKSNSSEDGYIRADRSVQVMSLTPHLLNLSTQTGGKGKLFQFFRYGDMKSIIYSDLSDILIACYDKAEKGAFYIFDKDVVRRHGLEPSYQNKILDKEAIDGFLDKSSDEIASVFSSLSDLQKEAVVSMIINKIVNEEDVSTNKVTVINRIYGEDIFAKADEMMNWEKEVAELESEK